MIRSKKRLLPDEDAELVASCRAGDLSAFETLVKKHQTRMFTLAFRVLGNQEDAGEVVQDAFVSAYRGLGKFRGDAAFTTWLTTITVNLARNRLQQMVSRRSREVCSLDDPIPGCGECNKANDPPSAGPSALELLEREEIRQRVQGCINGLEPGFREALVLRDVEEYSYGEIGTMLSLAEGTVKSRIARAREAIRACLKRVVGEF
ncbi:MAG: sigma-70 family RNA polymerase sigma factor [Geobacter sp.]|nr:MAG: sigma-70 family RNA polymerase sigma factor [Geobacter sp.]